MAAHLGMHASPTTDMGSWSGHDYSSIGSYGNGSPVDVKPQAGVGGTFKGLSAGPKKVTRDGQPAKRRGPKPDSKPAQTRRQELNRQAQRTHRERKEQYIKTLEGELGRLREAFQVQTTALDQRTMLLQDQQQENLMLRDILAARGIPYEKELENRKAALQARRPSASVGYSPTARAGSYQTVAHGLPSTSTGYKVTSDQIYGNGRAGSAPAISPGGGTTHHSGSPAGPEIIEQGNRYGPEGVRDMPGIFEKDPQLGIEFILALEATCRDHAEYLIRRSADSPNNPDEAQYSGHAMMASCPPPTHISTVPAQGGGFVPTYEHSVPDMSMHQLNVLLDLSKRIAAEGHVEGGQVTPIMALQSLRSHRNYSSLTRDDVIGMVDCIKNKVRCYGFGAVMADFELHDALSSIFATKPETYQMAFGNDSMTEVDDMY